MADGKLKKKRRKLTGEVTMVSESIGRYLEI